MIVDEDGSNERARSLVASAVTRAMANFAVSRRSIGGGGGGGGDGGRGEHAKILRPVVMRLILMRLNECVLQALNVRFQGLREIVVVVLVGDDGIDFLDGFDMTQIGVVVMHHRMSVRQQGGSGFAVPDGRRGSVPFRCERRRHGRDRRGQVRRRDHRLRWVRRERPSRSAAVDMNSSNTRLTVLDACVNDREILQGQPIEVTRLRRYRAFGIDRNRGP